VKVKFGFLEQRVTALRFKLALDGLPRLQKLRRVFNHLLGVAFGDLGESYGVLLLKVNYHIGCECRHKSNVFFFLLLSRGRDDLSAGLLLDFGRFVRHLEHCVLGKQQIQIVVELFYPLIH
jgi:hypothetical protein